MSEPDDIAPLILVYKGVEYMRIEPPPSETVEARGIEVVDKSALEFYADPKLYEVDGPLVGGAWGSPHYPIDDDRGAKAREALGKED